MATILPFCSDARTASVADSAPDEMAAPLGVSWYVTIKGTLDFVAALTLFIFTSPLLLAAMLVVKLTSRGPALYVQVRTGRNGKPFPIYKIRTMAHQCEKLTGVQWSSGAGDPRVFRIGRWLRRTHIDELPQLWNVIRGDMSLIGPRPERPEFVPQLEQAIAHYRQRLLLRPGVTGLAQVQLPPDSDLDSVRSKLAYDLYYLRHVNFWLDLRILAATSFKMVGLPFRLIRGCFGFPPKEDVDASYRELNRLSEVRSERVAMNGHAKGTRAAMGEQGT